MSPLFYAVVAIGVIIAIVLVWLLVDGAMRKYADWREARDMRVKNERLDRYNMGAFRGTKKQL